MSQIAIYIDTSAFFDAKLSIVENLKKLLKRNRDITLITNPVLTLEVDNIITEEMKKPLGLNGKYFRERDIKDVERILLENNNNFKLFDKLMENIKDNTNKITNSLFKMNFFSLDNSK